MRINYSKVVHRPLCTLCTHDVFLCLARGLGGDSEPWTTSVKKKASQVFRGRRPSQPADSSTLPPATGHSQIPPASGHPQIPPAANTPGDSVDRDIPVPYARHGTCHFPPFDATATGDSLRSSMDSGHRTDAAESTCEVPPPDYLPPPSGHPAAANAPGTGGSPSSANTQGDNRSWERRPPGHSQKSPTTDAPASQNPPVAKEQDVWWKPKPSIPES